MDRPRLARGALTRDLIVDAAWDLADEDGLDAASVRAVARRLGAAPMSIYGHFAHRNELVLALLERATAHLPAEVPGATIRDRLKARFVAAHDQLAPRRWVLLALVEGDLVPRNTFPFADGSLRDFLAAGMSDAEALEAHGMCWHLTLGEMLDRHPPTSPRESAQRERALRDMSSDRFPSYAVVKGHLDPTGQPPPCRFPRSIEVLLDGLLAGR